MTRNWIPVLMLFLTAAGCRSSSRQIRDPEYARVLRSFCQADADPAASAISPVGEELAGEHDVDLYIGFALSQNPEIQAARKQLEAMALRVPQAASLQDPMLQISTFPEPVQTAAGQQELLLAATQKFPWHGKLRTKASVAEASAEAARAQLVSTELQVIEQVKIAYYELYFVQQAIRITETDQRLLIELTKIAESKYRTGTTSQQDVFRAQLEVSNLDGELIRLRQQLASAQARLARRLHVSPETPVRASNKLPQERVPQDLDRLYRRAIMARPELHALLANIARDQHAVELARLNYYPDVTLGVSWIDTSTAGLSGVANGRDAVVLGVGVNMPIYRKRLDAGVREAEARAVASTRKYDSMRDQTLEEVKDLFARASSGRDLLQLFREDIIPKADQTLKVSSRAYQTGQVDFLQLIDNWRGLLRFQLTQERLETQLRQTLATLEKVLGAPVTPLPEAIPVPPLQL